MISTQNSNTIAANIALKFPESSGLEINRLIATGLVLFAITFAVNCRSRGVIAECRLLGSGRMTATSTTPDSQPLRGRTSSEEVMTSGARRLRRCRRSVARRRLGALAGCRGWRRQLGALGRRRRSLAYIVGTLTSRAIVEDRRQATDRLATAVVTDRRSCWSWCRWCRSSGPSSASGSARFDSTFFTETMRDVVGEGGGGYHAIIGTLDRHRR